MNRPRIILAGGSGFLGTELRPIFESRGYDIIVLTRSEPGDTSQLRWDASSAGPWVSALEGATAVVNLVGRSVDCRKTAANKREILESRIHSVRALAEGFQRCARPPAVWVQASTAHIYGDTDEQILDESSPIGTGFAPEVGRQWERALNEADLPNVRKVILRISFVLGRYGGALAKLARLTRFFLGGTVGSGQQYISWLHIDDLAKMILRAIEQSAMRGVYVATAPEPVPNRIFMRELRRALGRPWTPPTPTPLVHLGSLLLRTDPTLATLGRRCVPTRLLAEGFTFRHPHLREALADLLHRAPSDAAPVQEALT